MKNKDILQRFIKKNSGITYEFIFLYYLGLNIKVLIS